MDNKELADLIFPDIKEVTYYEEKYGARNLKEGAMVTRFAPSPTGFVHIGGLFSALVNKKLANQSDGVFFLRIEDTDKKREVENGVQGIVKALKDFKIEADEGMLDEVNEKGNYGPYMQSKRGDIYKAYVKSLLEQGKAYLCFCSPEELEEIRAKQEAAKERPGYYGKWAKCRKMPLDQVKERVERGDKYIIRFKSNGNPDKKIKHHDLIKGNVDFPENDQDIVILKSDGLPTYHFAHAVDDHLMHTTHVIRGDEWLSSVPVHIELFQALGFRVPKYAHISPIMKDENGSKRKLSKRKDPEAAVSYYHEQGIPARAVLEYLLNIANSNFEGWRRANRQTPIEEFELNLSKMGVSGAVFDMVKLLDISKTIISEYTAEQIYDEALAWAKQYDAELANLLEADKAYSLKVLNIERGNKKPRKDIAKWSDVKENIAYMYENEFLADTREYEYQKITDKEKIKTILTKYLEKYFDINDDKQTWFDKMKDLSEEMGYAREVKEFKANPEKYEAHVGDISTVIRVALTKRHNTPDLYEIMQVLGKDNVIKRIELEIAK